MNYILTRKLEFIVLGNKNTGKTTLSKVLTKNKPFTTDSTVNISKFSGKVKLLSSRKSSIFSFERWRKYKVRIIDTPGSFAERRQWRDAFKRSKKPIVAVFVVDPFQSIPETRSALEEVYNQYLESISNNLEKADLFAGSNPFFLLILFNHFSIKGKVDEKAYYELNLKDTIIKMKEKIPLMLVDYISFDFLRKPMPKYDFNAVLERIKRFRYIQQKV